MQPSTASAANTPFTAAPLIATNIQPAPAAGSPRPMMYSQQEHAASTFAEGDDDTDALGQSDATALNALGYQLRQIERFDSGNQAEIVSVFMSLKDGAVAIARALRTSPDALPLRRLSEALVAFLDQFNHALSHQPEWSGGLDVQAIRSICLGLSVCASPKAGIVFNASQQRSAGPALQGITDHLLTQLAVLGMPGSASANGMVLDILNWVSRGLKSELLTSNALIRTSFGQALELFAGWLGSDHSRGFMTVKQRAKCAVQIDLMVKRKLVALKAETPQGSINRTLLVQCATGLGSQAALVQLDTGPSSSSGQGTVDAVALINVCNAFRTLLEARLLQSDDSALARLPGMILRLTSRQLCAGTGQPLSNCSNFVRTLFETDLSAQPALVSMLEKAAVHLIETVNGADFAQGYAHSQSISNLMSFVKLCDKRLQAKAGSGKPGQADLVKAANVLYGQLMAHDPAQFHSAEAIGGLLSGLCYLWGSGLVALSGAGRDWLSTLMRVVAGMDAARWTDKSRRVMLPALLALIETGATTLAAAQAALALLLQEPASASSGYTAAELAQAVRRLGAIEEEEVVALPPAVIALQAGAPAQAAAQLPATLPRGIPGLTPVMTPQPVSLPTRFTTPATAPRRVPGGTAQDQWKTPARVARKEPLPMPAAHVLASQPTWSNAATSTAASSTTSNAATASSTTTTTTNMPSPAGKKAKARQKGAATATKARPQKPVQQWFALLTAKGAIDLKCLKDLARNQPGLVNKNDESGRNALFHAIARGDEKVVAWLIGHESHVAPAQTARFLALLMEEVVLYSPAFGAALRCFLNRQTATAKEEVRKHFEDYPPVMRGVEDILKACGLPPSQNLPVDGSSVVGPPERVTPGEMGFVLDQDTVQEWRNRAKQGDGTAQFNLAYCLEQGMGVEKNEKEAVRWYEKAASQGNATAQAKLGFCYQQGMGVAKNDEEAVRWYELAASQGKAVAQVNLALCYVEGTGVAKDEKKAIKWLRKADGQGHSQARRLLNALIVLFPDGGPDE